MSFSGVSMLYSPPSTAAYCASVRLELVKTVAPTETPRRAAKARRGPVRAGPRPLPPPLGCVPAAALVPARAVDAVRRLPAAPFIGSPLAASSAGSFVALPEPPGVTTPWPLPSLAPGVDDASAGCPPPPLITAAGAAAASTAATTAAQSLLRTSTSQLLTHWDVERPHSVARLP